jgi:translation elongation factor EF-1beta
VSAKAIIVISLVSESKDVDNEQIEREISKSLKCDWLAEIEKITFREHGQFHLDLAK